MDEISKHRDGTDEKRVGKSSRVARRASRQDASAFRKPEPSLLLSRKHTQVLGVSFILNAEREYVRPCLVSVCKEWQAMTRCAIRREQCQTPSRRSTENVTTLKMSSPTRRLNGVQYRMAARIASC